MRQSNQNFNIPPPRANLGYLTILFARGVGNLTFVSAGWGNLNRNWKVSNDFFWAPELLTAINTYLDEMEDFEGRDIAVG